MALTDVFHMGVHINHRTWGLRHLLLVLKSLMNESLRMVLDGRGGLTAYMQFGLCS